MNGQTALEPTRSTTFGLITTLSTLLALVLDEFVGFFRWWYLEIPIWYVGFFATSGDCGG